MGFPELGEERWNAILALSGANEWAEHFFAKVLSWDPTLVRRLSYAEEVFALDYFECRMIDAHSVKVTVTLIKLTTFPLFPRMLPTLLWEFPSLQLLQTLATLWKL